jgi:SOS-response transcriptional repressor LexA
MMARTPDRTGKTGSEKLARVVRERRQELGLSRQELADATGIPYPTIAQVETAYRGASPARLGVIARVLGLDPKELYDVLASEGAAGRASVPPPSPPPSPPSSAPPMSASPRGGARRSAAPTGAAGRWHANPQFAAALAAPTGAAAAAPEPPTSRRRSRSTDRTAEVVDSAVDLLSQLPAEERIEALGRVQNRLLERIVEERIRSAR